MIFIITAFSFFWPLNCIIVLQPISCPIFYVNLFIYLLSGHSPHLVRVYFVIKISWLYISPCFRFEDEKLLGILDFQLLLRVFRRYYLLFCTPQLYFGLLLQPCFHWTASISPEKKLLNEIIEYTRVIAIFILQIFHSPSVSLRS